MQERYDALVIGSGQGGTPLAKVMAVHGWRTALVERRYLGGVCTNDGCTPTKAMVASARVAALARRGEEFGVACSGTVEVSLRAMRDRALAMARRGRSQIGQNLSEVGGLDVIQGEASFAEHQPGGGMHAVALRLPDGATRTVVAERVFVDVGLRPQIPDVEGLAQTPYLDSSTVLQLGEVPTHLLVLGGGYIAMEFAQVFRRLGARVTLLERGAQILEHEDEDVAACLTEILTEDGIEIIPKAQVTSVRGETGAVTMLVNTPGRQRKLEGSHLLVATGRIPNTETLHLERVGVGLDDRGYVRVNGRLETGVPGIWALGDVTGEPAYSHISYDDFRVLRTNLLEGGSCSTEGRLVPYAVFTDPELGRVGMTEKQARAQGHDVRVAVAPMNKTARAQEMGETRGMMKAVVERTSDRLLGAAILGLSGGDVATQLQLAMLGGLTASQLREAIFIHPVMAEGLHVLFRSFRD